MSWFDEQIKQRKEKDDRDFAEAMEGIAAAVTRTRPRFETDDQAKAKSAIDAIFAFYHIKTREIPENMTDLGDQIDYLCRPNGILYRNVELKDGWYKDAVGAMLGRLADGTPVALLPDFVGGYSYVDGASGKKVRLNKKTARNLEGEAVCFYIPFPLRKLSVPDLLEYYIRCVPKNVMVWYLLMMGLSTLVGMLAPKITYIIFNQVVYTKSLRLLLAVAVLSVSVSIGIMLLNAFQNLLTDRLSTQADICVSAAAMGRVLSLPADFFKNYSSGELSTRMQYINSICTTLFSSFLVTGLTSVFSLAYVTQIFRYAPSLVVPSLCVTAVTIVLTIVTSLWNVKESRAQMELSSKEYGMSYALISGIQKIKLTGAEKRAFSRWVKLYTKEAKHTYGKPLFLTLSGTLQTAVSLISTLILYTIAVKTKVSVADYYAFTAAYGVVSGAFFSVAGIAMNLAQIQPTLEMAKPIMDAVPEISQEKQMVSRLQGNIELNGVTFRYSESSPAVLENLSLKIKAGQYVAIVGKTGCGKSTLVRLLLGFEKPQRGAVYYDGKDLNSLDARSVRRKIGTVLQDGKLFQGDIYSNIVISAPWLSVDDAWQAAELADVADDIRDMPMGMFTQVSEGGGGISGGQKQRLMIARAVAPKPNILIFDEATSALDNLTQKKVAQALDSLKCTRIVIAHRLSTIRQCDRIIVLDGGRIIEDGTYQELIDKKGFFAELVERQRVDV